MEEIINKNIKECIICGISANSFCFKCFSYFCDECFKYVHKKEKNNKHIKEEIDYFVPLDIKCPEHPRQPISLFCLNENGNKIYFLFNFKYYRTLLL